MLIRTLKLIAVDPDHFEEHGWYESIYFYLIYIVNI